MHSRTWHDARETRIALANNSWRVAQHEHDDCCASVLPAALPRRLRYGALAATCGSEEIATPNSVGTTVMKMSLYSVLLITVAITREPRLSSSGLASGMTVFAQSVSPRHILDAAAGREIPIAKSKRRPRHA